MPVTPTYPGVYIEEIPSGVRTITGVATSITAFVGRTRRGERDKATTINNFGDFERNFGGLWVHSQLGFAIRDFYLNGGSQAVIVRLYRAEEGGGAKPSKSKVAAGGVKLEAVSEGSWGANLRASVDMEGVSSDVALTLGVNKEDLFHLTVRDAGLGGATERFLNLTVKESARSIDRVLLAESKLVRWDGVIDPNNLPAIAKSSDAVTSAETDLATFKKALDEKLVAGGDATDEKKKVDDAQKKVDAELKKMTDAVSDGQHLKANDFLPVNGEADKKGLYALEQTDLFNLLCIPPYKTSDGVKFDVDTTVFAASSAYCEKRRAMLLVDAPSGWDSKTKAKQEIGSVGTTSKNAALFFPRLKQPNPLRDNQVEEFVPCGAVAGICARTDTQRGVWKAPAGLEATLVGVPQLSVLLTDAENGELNPLGVNCLRVMPATGPVVWGSRTLQGDDRLASEWKYFPVRRTALFIEESLYRGTQWVVFEPNDEPLWAQIRLNIGAFMHNLFRQGAFQGKTPAEAYFVKCDKETTTQNDINLGIVNIVVGFAPLKPAEFVIIKLQQMAGQIAT
jgi:uncharacterized protein